MGHKALLLALLLLMVNFIHGDMYVQYPTRFVRIPNRTKSVIGTEFTSNEVEKIKKILDEIIEW